MLKKVSQPPGVFWASFLWEADTPSSAKGLETAKVGTEVSGVSRDLPVASLRLKYPIFHPKMGGAKPFADITSRLPAASSLLARSCSESCGHKRAIWM